MICSSPLLRARRSAPYLPSGKQIRTRAESARDFMSLRRGFAAHWLGNDRGEAERAVLQCLAGSCFHAARYAGETGDRSRAPLQCVT